MGLVRQLLTSFASRKQQVITYKSEIDRLEQLYSDVTTRRFFRRKVDWMIYKRYAGMVPEIIKPAEWNWLNRRLIEERLISQEIINQLEGVVEGLDPFKSTYPLFSFFLNQASNHSYS